jgi:hypothetical protein
VCAQPLTVTRCAKSLVQTEVKKSDVKTANDGVDEQCFDVWRHVSGRSGYTAWYAKVARLHVMRLETSYKALSQTSLCF